MINLTDLFPYRKSFTDIVSFATALLNKSDFG